FGLVYRQRGFHSVMCESAQFRARDFVLAGFVWREPHHDSHSGNGVLLQPEVRQKEAVDDVLRAQPDSHRFPYWNMHYSLADDVIFRGRIRAVNTDVVR